MWRTEQSQSVAKYRLYPPTVNWLTQISTDTETSICGTSSNCGLYGDGTELQQRSFWRPFFITVRRLLGSHIVFTIGLSTYKCPPKTFVINFLMIEYKSYLTDAYNYRSHFEESHELEFRQMVWGICRYYSDVRNHQNTIQKRRFFVQASDQFK
jgi:hypothetical protein